MTFNPQPGDIVACRFPHAETPETPGPKIRPCLVTKSGDGRVTVAFGTDLALRANRGRSVIVSRDQDMRAASLRKPTRFVIERQLSLPADDRWFCCGRHPNPIIGALPEALLPKLHAVLAAEGQLVAAAA